MKRAARRLPGRWGTLGAVLLLLAGCKTPRFGSPPSPPAPTEPALFSDVAAAAGIRFQHTNGATGQKRFVEITGSGCAFVDYDRDGWLDVLLLDAGPLPGQPGRARNGLYHNTGDGKFVDVTSGSGLESTGYAQGVAAGDFDNDGYPDLYITAYGGNRLLRNDAGAGRFIDVTQAAGVGDTDQGKRYALSAAWGDYDRDGRLDLFVTHYARWSFEIDRPCRNVLKSLSYCSPEAYEGDRCRLYRNLGNGRFADVSGPSGVNRARGRGMGMAWLDYNRDGWQDIFVACDMEPNLLFRNSGKGTFTEVADEAGVALGEMGSPLSGMGVAVGDYDQDGREDLHVTNFSYQPNSLFWNAPGAQFENRCGPAGISEASHLPLGWGTEFLDYDRNGFPDLVVANGHIHEDVAETLAVLSFRQPKSLYQNNGTGGFTAVKAGLGDLAVPVVSRGLAVGDFDNDGGVDLLVNNQNGTAQLLRNQAARDRHWISFVLEGRSANRDGRHARLRVRAGERVLHGVVRAGSSFCSSSDPRVYFGLGEVERVDEVTVEWPGGRRSVARGLQSNQMWRWTEGDAAPKPIRMAPRGT